MNRLNICNKCSVSAALPTMAISLSSLNHNQTNHQLLEQKCSSLKNLQQIHAQLIKTDFINNASALKILLSLSLTLSPQTTALPYAIKLFNQFPNKYNAVLYNTMIRGFVNHTMPKLAILTYLDMLRESDIVPDRFTFPSLLKACARSPALINGKALHAQIVKYKLAYDLYIQTTLILMYSKCGNCNHAREVFDRMEKENKNEVVYTSMIDAYIKNQLPKQALDLFFLMQEEKGLSTVDEVTMATVISACGELRNLDYGKKLCFHVKQSNMRLTVVLGTSIVHMYSKCGELKLAREVFDVMVDKNVVCWSAMISGYSQNNQGSEALKLFKEMVKSSEVEPNEITVMAALAACSQIGNLGLGQWIHAYIEKVRLNYTVGLMNSLIDMYSKCGKIDLAFETFKNMPYKDIISYNSMINGLALHGLGDEALNQFDVMQNEDIKPDDVTFIGVLSACSHRGLVNEGHFYFKVMKEKFRIEPKVEHYGCMADLFSRAGMLEEAKKLITELPMKPNGAVWGALMSGCRLYNNAELGEEAAKHLLELEPYNDANYVLLSNIFALKKNWEEAKKVRLLMRKRGVRKKPGCSSIAINGDIHEFTVGDISHVESKKIYAMLDAVNCKLSNAGYVAQISEVLLNVDDEEKADMLSQHSEKLAVCYGLIKTTPGDEIHILNNLRVCRDCHAAIKMVSEIYKRKITVRDRSRFHHFEDGVCSCNDYW